MPPSSFRWLHLEQLDRRTGVWRSCLKRAPPPEEGWIHTVRTALGMTQEQLAKRMGVAKSRIGQIEKAEVDGRLTLATLQRAAEALGADTAVGLVPAQPLERQVEAQAERVARQIISDVDHTMALEGQRTSTDHRERSVERFKREILAGPWRVLWR